MSAYLAAPLQLDKICRVCLTQKCDMSPLYGACLDEMLNSFASIQVEQNDGLPSLLCVQCVRQCSRAYSFKQQCDKSDRILRELIKPEFQAELQQPVTLIDPKIELDETSELDQFVEMEGVVIKDELKTEFVPCPDLDLKPDQNTIEQNNDVKQEPNIVGIKVISASKEHQHDQCNETFANSSNLSKHNNKHAIKLGKYKARPYLCSMCDITFKWVSSLTKHMKLHTSNRLFSCNICNKKFADAKSLKNHVRSHENEKPYACDVCQKMFTEVCQLEDHAQVHTGEKPYISENICPVCGKGFSESGYMKVHMRTHTGVKPYVCQTCREAYATLHALRVHKSVHTGKLYKCKTCGKCFSLNKSLNKHELTHTRNVSSLIK